MLDSLLIKNFRAFEHLEIPSLSRVNLITGKNNTGKTSLLEAVYLFANLGFLSVINQLLTERDELPERQKIEQSDEGSQQLLLTAYASLFYQRHIDFDRSTSIMIGDKENQVSITFAKKINKLNVGNSFGLYSRTTLNDKFAAAFHTNLSGIRIQEIPTWNCQFVKSFSRANQNYPDNSLATLWDRQSLSDNSEKVIEALNLLEPIDRLAFIATELNSYRKPFIRLKSSEQLPLRSMGDGINRILHIALALVNCENGFLLIDEFENGLHYSVQENL